VSGLELLFAAFGVLAAAAGLLAVTSRQVVHSALWLVVCLGSLAGVYLVLGAELVALVQLLVYVGAVVVLVLFALMLTRAPIGVRKDLDAGRGQRAAAVLAGVSLAGLVGGTLLVAVGDATLNPDLGRGGPQQIGEAIFGGWALPFELLSLLLLAALVAALALSKDRSR
jgi:NADH-quinone oxidoreductase subunit J